MNNLWMLFCVAATAVACFLTKGRREHMLLLVAEDEDVKIADGHFSAPRTEDTSERAAREFLRQKESGNIDRARELGNSFAQAMLSDRGLLAGEMKHKSMQVRHHLYLLYSYVVSRVIAEYSPDSILAQTSLNQFYRVVENASQEMSRHVNDMAAFSLYILCERSKNRSDDEIGYIFAELCGVRGDVSLAEYGNLMFRKFYKTCVETAEKTPYRRVDGE